MARILLIDDDRALRDMLVMAIEDAGHQVLQAPDGLAGLAQMAQHTPELVVSDVNMPGLDGFSLCRRLRKDGVTVPIILLTARDGEIDEALGLELGADDYIVKPFHTRVLMARIEALLRREAMRRGQGPWERVAVGAMELDPDRMEAKYAGERITVTVTEFRMLCALAEQPGRVFSRQQLLDRMLREEGTVEERVVDTYIRRLRRKLEAVDPGFAEIETVVGMGYRWRDPHP